MNLKEKVKEYKTITAELTPKLIRINELNNKVRNKASLTKEEMAEYHELNNKIRELQFRGRDISLDVMHMLCKYTMIEEVAQGEPYIVEIGYRDLNSNHTLINKDGAATIVIIESEV